MTDQIGISSMSEKGQVTIPKEIRDRLQLKAGDKVIFIERDSEVVVHNAGTKKLSEILESHKPWKFGSIEYQRKARKEWK